MNVVLRVAVAKINRVLHRVLKVLRTAQGRRDKRRYIQGRFLISGKDSVLSSLSKRIGAMKSISKVANFKTGER